MQRRDMLRLLAAAGLLPLLEAGCTSTPARARLDAYPFTLGTASGYPTPDGFVLWTRLAPEPMAVGGGLDPAPIDVRWEVARDETMHDIVARGTTTATADWAHSVHIDVRGLAPDRWYWYRFSVGAAASPVARTRTAPAPDALPNTMRFAFASCQQFEQGWYGAHRHIAADTPDLVAFLGDYIYESSWGTNPVRRHDSFEPTTLDAYRHRYAQYKSDPDLQAAHAACPWVMIWDDHEVDNDYANDQPEDGMSRADFLLRRAAAYQAYYEHQPLPATMRPKLHAMRIHTGLAWGRLARFHLLDCRQYRAHEACPRLGRCGGSNVVEVDACAELAAPGRSMLGGAQETWLDGEFAASTARWNLIAQTTLMAQLDRAPAGSPRRAWTDGWDGYPAARRRLLDSVVAHRLPNPVVIGGDVHMHWVADLKTDFDAPDAPVVASEFVGTSITSQGMSQRAADALLARNPHLKYGCGDRRGYVRVDLAPWELRADLRGMSSVQTRDADCETLASFIVEDGRPGANRI